MADCATVNLVRFFDSKEKVTFHLATVHPLALTQVLKPTGLPDQPLPPQTFAVRYAQVRYAARHGRLDSSWGKFLLFSLLLTLPAFHLHQSITSGGGFGELYTFGVKAYVVTFAIWWATWSIGVFLSAAALRAFIEVGTVGVLFAVPSQAASVRAHLENIALVLLYLGLPGWLALHASW